MQLTTEQTVLMPTIRAKAHDVAKALQRLKGITGSKSLYPYSKHVLFKKNIEEKERIYLYAFDGETQISSWFTIAPEANSDIPNEFSFLVLEEGLSDLLKMLNNDDEVSISYDATNNQINLCFYDNKYIFPCATLDKYDLVPYHDIFGTSFQVNANHFYSIIERLEVSLDDNKNNLYGIFLEINPIYDSNFKITWMTTDAQFMIVNEVIVDTVINYNNQDNKFVINPNIISVLRASLDKTSDDKISFIVNSKLCSVSTDKVRLASANPSIKFVSKDIVANRLVKFYSFVFSAEALRNALKRLHSIYKTNPMLSFQIIDTNSEVDSTNSLSSQKLLVIKASNFEESITGQDTLEISVLDSESSQPNYIEFRVNGSTLKEIAKTLDDGNYMFTISESKNLGLLQKFDDVDKVSYNSYVYIALQTN